MSRRQPTPNNDQTCSRSDCTRIRGHRTPPRHGIDRMTTKPRRNAIIMTAHLELEVTEKTAIGRQKTGRGQMTREQYPVPSLEKSKTASHTANHRQDRVTINHGHTETNRTDSRWKVMQYPRHPTEERTHFPLPKPVDKKEAQEPAKHQSKPIINPVATSRQSLSTTTKAEAHSPGRNERGSPNHATVHHENRTPNEQRTEPDRKTTPD